MIMERLSRFFGIKEKAFRFRERAAILKKKCNEICWNGNFYTHFVKLNECFIEGVREEEQLSMANPMAINRGLANIDMSRSIIEEYLLRKEQNSGHFAEWYSIDPPFPGGIFGDEKLKAGAYINGGIFPLAGGELALAAMNSGYEKYGIDILSRYFGLIKEKGGSWLWYFPDGTPSSAETSTSPEAISTDGWGSTAMLCALVHGLAGIEDQSKLFEEVRFSPRWTASESSEAHVRLEYKSSGAYFEYQFREYPDHLEIKIESNGSAINGHILLPDNKMVYGILFDDIKIDFDICEIGSSFYLDFKIVVSGSSSIIIKLS
jgi:hypothetical protein